MYCHYMQSPIMVIIVISENYELWEALKISRLSFFKNIYKVNILIFYIESNKLIINISIYYT